MYSQTFTVDNLYRLSRQSERREFAPDTESKEALMEYLGQVCEYIINNDRFEFKFRQVEDVYVNGYEKGSLEALVQELVIRKIYENIRRIYKIKQANRNCIIKQLIVLLTDTYPSFIIRLDIRKFYESIDKEQLMSRLEDDVLLNHHSISLLREIFKNPQIKKVQGLPRGLSISSVLSELFMDKIDKEIKHLSGVYYYERFVDDIIVFCNGSDNFLIVQKQIHSVLNSCSLSVNYNKLQYIKDYDFEHGKILTYLGYSISKTKPTKKNRHCNVLDIELAPSKYNFFKTKITKSFVHYLKNRDYELLKQRIKYLTGNYLVSNPTDLRPIKAGIYYNYPMLRGKGMLQLKALDVFYQHILHCKSGNFGISLSSKLNYEQIHELEDFGFVAGWEKRMLSCFTPTQISVIKKCWL